MQNIQEQYNKLKADLEKLCERIAKLENQLGEEAKIDFSQWIGRLNTSLAIKGKGGRYLVIDSSGLIEYDDYGAEAAIFNHKLSYRIGKMKDLQYGDVFILKDDLKDIKLYYFNIFVGKDEDGDYVVQYLGEEKGVQTIKSDTYDKYQFEYEDVIIFNRF